jgi:anti-anti-sigma regulatory factor
LEISIAHLQGRVPVTVFHIRGDIDANTFDQLEGQARLFIQDGTRYLALELGEVAYISSYGIRGISQIYRWLREAANDETDEEVSQGVRAGTYKSPHLKLVNPSPAVLRVMSATGLDMYLEVHYDLKHSVASF